MPNRIFALTLALVAGLAAAAAGQSSSMTAAMKSTTIKLNAQNRSGETGTATLTQNGADLVVSVKMTGGNSAGPQPIHIHQGTCAKLNPQPYIPLTTVQSGTSKTTIKGRTLASLETGGFAINVHHSTSDLATYVACGNIPKMSM